MAQCQEAATAGSSHCSFRNLYIWDGELFYVTSKDAKPPELPAIKMSWDIADAELEVNIISAKMFSSLWQNHPHNIFKDAVLWDWMYVNNYGHTVGEQIPSIHMLLCERLGRCNFSEKDLRDVRIFFLPRDETSRSNQPASADEKYHAYGPDGSIGWQTTTGLGNKEAFRCLAKDPPRYLNSHELHGVIGVLEHAVAGIGPQTRAHLRSERYTRTGPTPWVMERYYVRLSECLGLDPDRKADLEHPRLLIIDRKVEKGRAFENADLVQRQLQTSFPTVTVAMQKVTGLTWQEQANLYSNVSLLMQAHGAALGNYPFLPRNAAILDISPATNHHVWADTFVADMKSLNWTLIDLPPQQSPWLGLAHNGSAKASKPQSYDNFWQDSRLTDAQRDLFISGGITCDEVAEPVIGVCKDDWALHHSVIRLNMTQLVTAIRAGFHFIGAHI